MLSVEFSTATVAEPELAAQIARILRSLAETIEAGRCHGAIVINGQRVGGWVITEG